MNSQQLLYVNIILGLFFAAYFLLGRSKPRAPTKLNIKANEDFKKSILLRFPEPGQDFSSISSERMSSNSSEPKMTVLEPENLIDLNASRAKQASKNLNIYFMYNGHSWEAHEVLGVPAGAPMTQVTDAYQKLILTNDSSTYEFYESANQAILKRWRDRL